MPALGTQYANDVQGAQHPPVFNLAGGRWVVCTGEAGICSRPDGPCRHCLDKACTTLGRHLIDVVFNIYPSVKVVEPLLGPLKWGGKHGWKCGTAMAA